MRRIATAALIVAACARPLPPPGGEQDQTAPVIIGTTPTPGTTIEPTDDAVVFRFDETLAERGVTDAVVLVSPRTGETRVERNGSELRVRIEGGWQPGVVYRVVLLPGVTDRFRNSRTDPAELVFSTGPEIPTGVIAGLVFERITGRASAAAVVEASPRGDSLAYLTVPDSAAFFALQNLAVGTYDLRAFEDRNSNRTLDPGEPSAGGTVVTLNRAADTLTAVLQIVPFDTVPPRVRGATVRDSLQIRVTTDDYLDPDAPIELVTVSLMTLPDSSAVPGTPQALSVVAFDSLRAIADSVAQAARADSVSADSAQVPPVRTPPRQAPPGRLGGPATGGVSPLGGPLPVQEFVVVPPAPLAPGRYLLTVSGLTNVSARTGGGGTATFEVAEPVQDTTAARDTTTVRDTTPPDTTGGRAAVQRRAPPASSPFHPR